MGHLASGYGLSAVVLQGLTYVFVFGAGFKRNRRDNSKNMVVSNELLKYQVFLDVLQVGTIFS